MLIKLPVEAARRYASWLETYEGTYGKAPGACERFEAFQCARSNNRRPYWIG